MQQTKHLSIGATAVECLPSGEVVDGGWSRTHDLAMERHVVNHLITTKRCRLLHQAFLWGFTVSGSEKRRTGTLVSAT